MKVIYVSDISRRNTAVDWDWTAESFLIGPKQLQYGAFRKKEG